MLKKKKIEVVYLKDRSALSLQRFLRVHLACEQAREFAKGKTLKEAWGKCTNHSWLTWYVNALNDGQGFSLEAERAMDVAYKAYCRAHKGNKWLWQGASKAKAKAFRQYYKVA